MALRHSNKDRQYFTGEIIDAHPQDKSHRKAIPQEQVDLANSLYKLIQYFNLKEQDVYNLIKEEFGQGVGYQTTRIFLDRVYGPGFKLRYKTYCKYKYLNDYLLKKKKQFAKSAE